MFDIKCKDSLFLYQKKAGKHLHDNGKIISLVTSLLGGLTDGYSTYAGGKAPGGALHAARRQGIFIPWPLGAAIGPGPNGYTAFSMVRNT